MSSKTAPGKGMTIFGVIAIVTGMLCMLMPGITGLSVSVFIGVRVLIGGISRMIWAFTAGSLGRGVWMFLVGALTLIAGIMLVSSPLFAASVLTILLVIYFLVDGISEVAAGALARPARGSGWLIFGGVISILLGIMIWRQYPLSGMWAIGVLFGIKLFFVGLIMVTGGTTASAVAKGMEGD